MKHRPQITAAIVGSLGLVGLGTATSSIAAPSVEGAPDTSSSCDALAAAANNASVAVDKIHDIGPTIAPALPHPDNPELETGQVNMVQLFFQSRDIAGSLHRASSTLRAANDNVDIENLRAAAEDLAQADEDTAAAFDSASNLLAPRPSMDELSGQIFEHIKTTMNAFHHFNDLYSAQCGVDLRPDWDNPAEAAAQIAASTPEAEEELPPPADEELPPEQEAQDDLPPAQEQQEQAEELPPAPEDAAPPADDQAPEAQEDGDGQ